MMASSIRDLILTNLPEDGSAISNSALLALLQDAVPDLTEDEYREAKDDLVAEGLLAEGLGRGGTVFLAGVGESDNEQDDSDEEDSDFALEAQDPDQPLKQKGKAKEGSKGTKTRKPNDPVQVVSYRHTETRVNNPEVGMVHPDNDPEQPKTTWRFDAHLDPSLMFDSQRSAIESLIDDALASGDLQTMQDALKELKELQRPYLNWAGKADRTSFDVDTVSLHVHERIDPATILASVRKRLNGTAGTAAEVWRQPDLFAAPFENLPLRQAIDFYRHEKGWSNRLIAGDSLLVMNSLLQKESMAGKVQMIYFDPPYGIKYGSNFQPFTNKRDVKDGADADLTQEPEMIKAFRDTWELGIHSYLTYLRDRLWLAKELLHESGSVFLQISDENAHLVRALLDEVLGPQNFIAEIAFRKSSGIESAFLPSSKDWIIWYGKNKTRTKFRNLYSKKIAGDAGASQFTLIQEADGRLRKAEESEMLAGLEQQEARQLLSHSDPTAVGSATTTLFEFEFQGRKLSLAPNRRWRSPPAGMSRLDKSLRLMALGDTLRFKKYLADYPVFAITDWWDDTGISGFGRKKEYVVETAETVIERCLLMTTDPGDLVLDPTCGSGTTAFVAEKWGRRWITCDTSRVAITLAKQRLMTAGFDYFRLAYPHEGLSGGFVYQTVPHITLKSIANNPDIDTIYDTKHPAIAAELLRLNNALSAAPSFRPAQGYRKDKPVSFDKGERLEEWEVPFDLPEIWPPEAAAPFAAFHAARQAMQAAMDASIQANAEPETLYDKPDVDKTRLRITGPFSVEAVPAPAVVSLDEGVVPEQADATIARSGETSRQNQWRDELIRTGIRAKGGAMFRFTDLEAIPGLRHLHASGNLESGERVVVSFGPEHATLEQRQVAMALSEAETLRPAPKFIVFCAFTFDPEAAKDIDETSWPGVTLLKAQMNTDLLTEDLKKARSSNQSFWLMGQPEIELRRDGDLWQVEVHGFDYFDPASGELTSGGKNKIAMWSLDIDYDGRSLMPLQVFFPMAGTKDGWNRLKKTIRAELDDDLLEKFHGTVSLPFEAGDHRRVAVKIVDDRGIESLKIMNLE
jgi:adenine-specific DNA-methyltransferase